jgi:hypothetical protein
MKLKCINKDRWIKTVTCFWGLLSWQKYLSGPKYGDIVTSTEDLWAEGEKYYALLEWPSDNHKIGFKASLFVPIEFEFEKVSYSKVVEETPVGVN